MITEAMEKVIELAQPEIMEIKDRSYSTKPLFPVREPIPDILGDIRTLTGLADYLESNVDKLEMAQLLFHIQGPTEVYLYSRLTGEFLTRPRYLIATADVPDFHYGHYYDIEKFIIKLQTAFLSSEPQGQLLSIVGNLKDSNTKKFKDDGVTQEVTIAGKKLAAKRRRPLVKPHKAPRYDDVYFEGLAWLDSLAGKAIPEGESEAVFSDSIKTGITRVEETEIPNPIILQPYRTFLEIEQPASPFIFRLKAGPNEASPVCAALFEADGGVWRLQAITRIRDWIKGAVSGVAVIA